MKKTWCENVRYNFNYYFVCDIYRHRQEKKKKTEEMMKTYISWALLLLLLASVSLRTWPVDVTWVFVLIKISRPRLHTFHWCLLIEELRDMTVLGGWIIHNLLVRLGLVVAAKYRSPLPLCVMVKNYLRRILIKVHQCRNKIKLTTVTFIYKKLTRIKE